MSGFALTSVAVLFDKTAPLPMRALAFGGVVLAPVMLLKAQSAGSTVFLIAGVGVSLVLVASRELSANQKLLMMAGGAAFALVAVIVVYAYQDFLFNSFLNYSGEDVTLTGRTDLWAVAFELIRERLISRGAIEKSPTTGFDRKTLG